MRRRRARAAEYRHRRPVMITVGGTALLTPSCSSSDPVGDRFLRRVDPDVDCQALQFPCLGLRGIKQGLGRLVFADKVERYERVDRQQCRPRTCGNRPLADVSARSRDRACPPASAADAIHNRLCCCRPGIHGSAPSPILPSASLASSCDKAFARRICASPMAALIWLDQVAATIDSGQGSGSGR
jgi:hypothetical protein